MESYKLAIEKFCKELKLKGIDVRTQDFECEAVDASRIQDFILEFCRLDGTYNHVPMPN